MSRNILVVNGHPDPRPERFCAALCDAYESGARARGCATRRLDAGTLALAGLADPRALDALEQAWRLLRAADRLAIVYPLWADAPPAALSALFDMLARLDRHLGGAQDKAARVVVTTALPAFLYRDKPAAALRGIAAAPPLFIGSVESISCTARIRWLEQMRGFGESLC